MIRLDTAFHAFTVNDEDATKLQEIQDLKNAIFVSINGIAVCLVREDEPKTQLTSAEYLLGLSQAK